MKTIYKRLVVSTFVAGLATTAAQAQDMMGDSNGEFPVAVHVKAGTTGLGLELATSVHPKVNIRAGFSTFKIGASDSADDVDYDLDLKLATIGGYVDFHPFEGSFRLTGGLVHNGNKISGAAEPNQDLEIGDRTYTPAEVGSLQASLTTKDFAPYLGLGWGNSTQGDGRFSFLFDVGILYQGSPRADLQAVVPANSPLNDDPALLAELNANIDKELTSFREDISNFKVYPVVSFGIAYRF